MKNIILSKPLLAKSLSQGLPIFPEDVDSRTERYDSFSISTSRDYRASYTKYTFKKPYPAGTPILVTYIASQPTTSHYVDQHRELRLYNKSGQIFQTIPLTIQYNSVTLLITPSQDCKAMEWYLGSWYRDNSYVTIQSISYLESGVILVNLNTATSVEQSFTLPACKLKLELVGGGGGGGGYFIDAKGRHIQYASGASGGALVCEIQVPAGTYFYRCGGAGDPGGHNYNGTAGSASYFSDQSQDKLAQATGGGNGVYACDFNVVPSGGIPSITGFTVLSTSLFQQGNPGLGRVQYSDQDTAGGASVYQGFGKGGGSKTKGTDGLCRITYLGA